ncbi:hypothetical protein [Veronia pacifica]|uniref:FAD-binding FR-type domain-containing protein n=1 Tax=Veronia pacifica TaxID=1080227 RepID=A0A1C3EER8_9GAMM|nr:hypothetical protein [Veronia pacifica]ODA31735.1 hypothetical protein A8L45_15255 [Veronia pacifica]
MVMHVENTPLPAQQSMPGRLLKHRALEHYVRLFILVCLTNAYFAVDFALSTSSLFSTETATFVNNMVVGNFFITVLVRQQYVINFLFWLATRAPVSWPLSVRWHLGKVYHHGGLHTGSAVCGTLWFALLLGVNSTFFLNGNSNISQNTFGISVAIMVSLLVIITMSLPKMRNKYHNQFEMVHRFVGWTVLGLFWSVTLSQIKDTSPDATWIEIVKTTPTIWLLAVMTFSVLLPWLRLRKVPVEITTPSSHVALLKFKYGVTPFAGSSMAISRSPLREWHQFANVPSPHEEGYRLTVSRAGDWTGRLIDDKPTHLWVKGIPTAGVANIEVLFDRVVYVATGSGIGPCLPHLLAKKLPMKLVWVTRNPRKTFGDQLVDEILEAQPDAVIWDTDAKGKPDMVALSYQVFNDYAAEAIICISNQKLTQQVVYGMESRGIPAFGAIWDS